MAKAKSDTVFKVTPIGIARYCWLDKPDTKFAQGQDDEGVYKCSLRLDPNDAANTEFLDEVQKLLNAACEAWKKENPTKLRQFKVNDPVKPEVDKDTGRETGMVLIATKTQNKPKLYDAGGVQITDPGFKVYGGSTVRLAVGIRPSYMAAYGVGLTMYLNAVQVIKASSRGGNPFEAVVVDGFEAEGESEEATEAPAANADKAKGLF